MNVNFGIRINAHARELGLLKPTIQGWGNAIVDYCKSFPGKDAPYYYNERANISLLAAGAWRSGAVALEEYSTKKAPKKAGFDQASGRCDLLFCVGNKYDFQIEAKLKWIRASSKEETVNNLGSVPR